MKNVFNIFIGLLALMTVGLPQDLGARKPKVYSWEKNRTELLNSTDMVLIYGGGSERYPFRWTTDRFDPYVNYIDRQGKGHWMFDAFLFLELSDKHEDGSKVMFTYYVIDKSMTSATKEDWKRLADYYFCSDTGVGALDKSVAKAEKTLGKQAKKRRVVIAIPEPLAHQTPTDENTTSIYWGSIDGKTMDFAQQADRIAACKWYVDYVRAKFNEMKYENVELAGFYWLSETTGMEAEEVIRSVGEYVNQFKYNFSWIPYYGAQGHDYWERLGFNTAYYQPNYFFNVQNPYTLLETACQTAIKENLHMEFEFDYRAAAKNDDHNYANRMRDYMKAFKDYKIWDNKYLSYYQGGYNFLTLKESADPEDQDLYHDFCEFVISRPIRQK